MKDYSVFSPFLILYMCVEDGEQSWGPLHVILTPYWLYLRPLMALLVYERLLVTEKTPGNDDALKS